MQRPLLTPGADAREPGRMTQQPVGSPAFIVRYVSRRGHPGSPSMTPENHAVGR